MVVVAFRIECLWIHEVLEEVTEQLKTSNPGAPMDELTHVGEFLGHCSLSIAPMNMKVSSVLRDQASTALLQLQHSDGHRENLRGKLVTTLARM